MPPVEGTIHGPLAGIRVIDLSTVLAGPYATMILGDLGADVVKIEPPDGDATRGWGPPWVGDEAAGTRTAAYYLAVNRNKRSLRLDLRTDPGREVLRRLLAGGDVLIENLRPGSLDRLGFDDTTITSINPALIHLAITGYGTSGPAADRPGYDFVIQAVGGLMSITGEADEDGGRPMKVGVAISDVVTGLYAAIGVLAGLLARRDAGQRVDVSLLGSTLAVLVNQAQNAFVTGESPARRGNAHPNIVPYETFATADGELAVAVGSERQWPRFCEALGLPELVGDPRFATNGDRVEHRAELRPILAGRFGERSTAAWGAVLDAADVPWGALAGVASALASSEAAALEAVVDVEHPVLGALRQVGIPLRFATTPGSIRTAPPLLGEHTDEVLGEIGYAAPEIAALRERGVV
jgi:glutaryl-CoA transferase